MNCLERNQHLLPRALGKAAKVSGEPRHWWDSTTTTSRSPRGDAANEHVRMRIKLIEDLPMASGAELYQLSWVIEQLLADPRRIVQTRAELHAGQQVQ